MAGTEAMTEYNCSILILNEDWKMSTAIASEDRGCHGVCSELLQIDFVSLHADPSFLWPAAPAA